MCRDPYKEFKEFDELWRELAGTCTDDELKLIRRLVAKSLHLATHTTPEQLLARHMPMT